MKTNCKKRILSFAVACVLIITTGTFMVNAQEITPRYNNVESTSSSAAVSSSGVITVTNNYTANSSVFTKAVITTCIEKRTLGLFWSKVDIGQTNDEWVVTSYNNSYLGSHSHQLTKTGTYRATVEYVFYGSGGSADNITKEVEVKY
ncbi:MAG: hypothetical protein IKI97_00765 [Clostridia bacterium]|nr:hypothetical protein [Clostridia bacterium]